MIIQDDDDEDVVYLLPSEPYEYDHPEGTGDAVSPFSSIWYCGIGKQKVVEAKRCNAMLVTSLQELRMRKAIPTQKRPNPKQRRKKRKAHDTSTPAAVAAAGSKTTTVPPTSSSATGKASRHRDESGQRTKRRF